MLCIHNTSDPACLLFLSLTHIILHNFIRSWLIPLGGCLQCAKPPRHMGMVWAHTSTRWKNTVYPQHTYVANDDFGIALSLAYILEVAPQSDKNRGFAVMWINICIYGVIGVGKKTYRSWFYKCWKKVRWFGMMHLLTNTNNWPTRVWTPSQLTATRPKMYRRLNVLVECVLCAHFYFWELSKSGLTDRSNTQTPMWSHCIRICLMSDKVKTMV